MVVQQPSKLNDCLQFQRLSCKHWQKVQANGINDLGGRCKLSRPAFRCFPHTLAAVRIKRDDLNAPLNHVALAERGHLGAALSHAGGRGRYRWQRVPLRR